MDHYRFWSDLLRARSYPTSLPGGMTLIAGIDRRLLPAGPCGETGRVPPCFDAPDDRSQRPRRPAAFVRDLTSAAPAARQGGSRRIFPRAVRRVLPRPKKGMLSPSTDDVEPNGFILACPTISRVP